jgi:ABC-2 type transport system ATP-binding protein
MEAAVSFTSATRCFGELRAVDELTFTVQEGEVFGLLGPNGAGKTTTLNLLTGLLKPDQGEIKVLGKDPILDARNVRRQIGMVPQDTNLYEDLNALDNLWHHASLFCEDLSIVQARIEELLSLVDLWSRRNEPVWTYSGGMKRRLVLARALLHGPEIILFDEPTMGVDVQGTHAIWEHIRSQRESGKTFIISTNDMTEADKLCDRLVIIDHGREVASDTPENLKAALHRDIVTIRTTPNIDDPELVFMGIHFKGVTRPEPGTLRLELEDAESRVGDLVSCITTAHRLEAMRIARPSLDDVFLHHTGHALRE